MWDKMCTQNNAKLYVFNFRSRGVWPKDTDYFGKIDTLKRANQSVEQHLNTLGHKAEDYFIEDKEQGIIKISFRSKGDFSVNQFARNHFEGGGHDNAAGGKSDLSLSNTVTKFTSLLHQYQQELADFNNDGIINILDIVELINLITNE